MDEREPTYERLLVERDALKTEAIRLFDENRMIRQQDAEIRSLRHRLDETRAVVRELHGLLRRNISPETLGRVTATIVTEQGIPPESALNVMHAVMGYLGQGAIEALRRAEIECEVLAEIGAVR